MGQRVVSDADGSPEALLGSFYFGLGRLPRFRTIQVPPKDGT
jgi:hypothetical protein